MERRASSPVRLGTTCSPHSRSVPPSLPSTLQGNHLRAAVSIINNAHISCPNSLRRGLERYLNRTTLSDCQTFPAIVLLQKISTHADARDLELSVSAVR